MPDEKKSKAATVHEALHELRDEVIKSRNMAIKVDNNAQNLVTIVKDLERRQSEFHTRARVSSFGVYLLFAVVIGGLCYLWSEERQKTIATERDAMKKDRDAANERARHLELDAQREKEAERVAMEVLDLLDKERVVEGIRKWVTVDKTKLSPLVIRLGQARIATASLDAARKALDRGQQLAKAGAADQALTAFDEVLTFAPQSPHATDALMAQAEIYKKRRDYEPCGARYIKVADDFPQSNLADDALYYAGECYDKAEKWSPAAVAYERIVKNYPESGFVGLSRTFAQRMRYKADQEEQKAKAAASKPATGTKQSR